MCVANDPASFSEFPSLGLFARKLAELPGPSGTPSGKFQGLGVGAEEQGGPFAAWGLYSMSQFFFFTRGSAQQLTTFCCMFLLPHGFLRA